MSIKVGSDFSGVGAFDLASEINFLLGCEESQAVCIELRKLGINAFSCDTQECSGGYPEWHFKQDIFEVIKGGYLTTQSGETVFIDKWHCGIFFPPCTYIAVSGLHWNNKVPGRNYKTEKALQFVCDLLNISIKNNINHIAIENPVGCISTRIFKYYDEFSKEYSYRVFPNKLTNGGLYPTQTIQPYYFGDEARKKTCLWLINLPLLFHNQATTLFENSTHVKEGKIVNGYPAWMFNNDKKHRSKTFPGIARAMAEQWGEYAVKRISADN